MKKAHKTLRAIVGHKYPENGKEYLRAIEWKRQFAARGLKLKNQFIPDGFVYQGE